MMGTDTREEIDFKSIMLPVAVLVWGDVRPNGKPTERRFGQGRMVDEIKGVWIDRPAMKGGGVLDLLKAELNIEGKEAFDWLRDHGFLDAAPTPNRPNVEEDRGFPDQIGESDPVDNVVPLARAVEHYDYTDEEGRLLYRVLRMETGELDAKTGKPAKTFRQTKPDGKGGFVPNLQGVQPTLYRLPELLSAIADNETVFVVEGERKVHTLEEWGFAATCNSGGSGKWQERFSAYLRGAKVVIIPDNDGPGEAHLKKVGEMLADVAESVRVLRLPDLPPKGDIVDWKAAGGTFEQFLDALAAAPGIDELPFESKFNAVELCDIGKGRLLSNTLISDIYVKEDVAMLAGESQSGKTFVALEQGMAIARHLPWNGKRVEGGLVLYQAGEGRINVERRIQAYLQENGVPIGTRLPFVLLPKRFDLYSSDDQVNAMIEEAKHWRRRYREHPLRAVFIDTFNKAFVGGDENKGQDVSKVLSRCYLLAEALQCTVILVHHMNAGGEKERGHTSIRADVETSIHVLKTDARDADGRQIRKVVVSKQKDGENGLEFPFVLKRVEIGRNEFDEPVTSCICTPPNGEVQLDAEETGHWSDEMHTVWTCIQGALQDYGMKVPPVLQLPASIQQCVEASKVVRAYTNQVSVFPDDADAKEVTKIRDAARKSCERAMEKLKVHGYIGREQRVVWLTDKRPGKKRKVQERSYGAAGPDVYTGETLDDDTPF